MMFFTDIIALLVAAGVESCSRIGCARPLTRRVHKHFTRTDVVVIERDTLDVET